MNNKLQPKSYNFALRIINLYKYLCDKNEYVLSKQILRSGTSIGANITEAEYAITKKEFVSKMQIALKEAAETEYWLKLLCKSQYITNEQFISIHSDCEELIKLLIAVIKTGKKNMSENN